MESVFPTIRSLSVCRPMIFRRPPPFFCRGCRHVSNGFTLAELLFGLAILAVLAGLLFPVFTVIRAQTRQTVCLGNVRSVLTATIAYTLDKGGHFPTVDQIGEGSLVNLLHPDYLTKKTVFCPIRPKNFQKPANMPYEPFSYAYNIGLVRNFPSYTTVNAPHHRVVLISELSNDTNFSTVGHLNSTLNRGRELGTPDYPIDGQYHGSKARRGLNMGFLDGHAELVRPERNDFGYESPSGYGNETNGGYFYTQTQFTKIKNGEWIIQR